jgi:hypothetical protein
MAAVICSTESVQTPNGEFPPEASCESLDLIRRGHWREFFFRIHRQGLAEQFDGVVQVRSLTDELIS